MKVMISTKLKMRRNVKDKVMMNTKVKVRGKEMARNVRGMKSKPLVGFYFPCWFSRTSNVSLENKEGINIGAKDSKTK